ncbi:MAG TPA: mechanosensitive ion channel family protein [Alphaproteobacteria bacterium]|nr:mechanosensitive ion channel family protein [Alphaproteobacteria bacterium]
MKPGLGSLNRRLARLLLLGLTALVASGVFARAQTNDPAASPATPAPQVRLLLDLLEDPEVRAWLEQQRQGQTAAPPPESGSPAAVSPKMVSTRIDRLRQNLTDLAAAIPRLPEELERVRIILLLEFQQTGLFQLALLFAFFVALGLGFEGLYRLGMRSFRGWITTIPTDTPAGRVRIILFRLAYGIGQVAAFALGSIGAFLPFDWPLLLRDIVLGYLLALLALRVVLALLDVVLAPRDPTDRLRLAPVTSEAARFWRLRLGLLIGWFAFGYVMVTLLGILGLFPEGRRLVAYFLGLGLLAIGLETLWRHPRQPAATRRLGLRVTAICGSVYLVLLWALWVAGAMGLFWLLALAVLAPLAIRGAQRALDHVVGAEDEQRKAKSLYAVSVERGLRAVILVGTALLLAHLWGIDLIELTARDTLLTRLLRGALSAIVIVMIADLLWQLAKTMIDRKIGEAQMPAQADTEEVRRRSRLRTLLPILRNLLAIVFLLIALMMVLSAIGIEIGPLIAGAGVVGVAIGFGAQTLVKDVISGMFYLLDDAFRVGEYIQSGNYKGTVESFSLRSVKLRHHRGPLYTVPFGELGAVQNMSRDWVIDKLTVGVTYDTDLDKAKKLIKQIGKELAADPEFAPNLLETLKMQGVEQFGDFAIQLRMKMMTRPGEQFVIRRRAYSMIKQAFDANGIKFALPTVQVAEGGETAAAARQVLEKIKTPAS